MGKEIERKFLVSDESFRGMTERSQRIRQSYLSARPEATVRLRVSDERAWLTVKSLNHGAERGEWEYEIPLSDALEMLPLAQGGEIDKTRHIVPYAGHIWEVDEFHGRLAGLIVAEVELQAADEDVHLPPFVGEEVTGDSRYYNSALSAL